MALRVSSARTMAYLDSKDALCEVKLPWIGQQPTDTYEAIIDSLLALDSAVSDVLGRVEQRVARERGKLRALETRIDSAAQRARRLAGSKAATVIYSAARYPAPSTPEPFERLFYDAGALERRAYRAIEVPEEPPAEGFEAMAERRRALDRCARASVDAPRRCIGEYESDLALRPELASNAPEAGEGAHGGSEGLAPIPPFVSTTASTVLFNSRHAPYEGAPTSVDNLSGENAPRRVAIEAGEAMAEAPQTVRLGDELPEVERIEYSYKPLLGDVPELNVPSVLPVRRTPPREPNAPRTPHAQRTRRARGTPHAPSVLPVCARTPVH